MKPTALLILKRRWMDSTHFLKSWNIAAFRAEPIRAGLSAIEGASGVNPAPQTFK
jgi:hypothetical protein